MATAFSRIPEEFEFPWGYPVVVKQVPPDDPELEGDHAAWDVTTRTIWLDKAKPIAERRWCFLHELDHAYNDWKLWVGQHARIRTPEEPTDEETTEDS